ncbi:hypothetical protein ILUMI_14747 [Ignelater luminosus]|uniref:Uncharacterized protein n=1 Tax=Ignelater luminosus TaxID=2038154 RepID=A0A8K0CTN1_IGNLU|nr:hypothetical protein ILUMI_14747 [Ignelater luminosus]
MTCLMVRCKKDTSSEEFYEICRKTMVKTSVLKKFQSLLCKSFGYSYLIKQELDILQDCMGKIKALDCSEKKLDKQQLHELLNYYRNAPMPKNGKVPYHILIGTQTVNWKNDDFDYYPVIMKVHHAVADGVSLLKMMVAVVADKLEVTKEPINPLNRLEHARNDVFVNKKLKKFINGLGKLKMLLLISFLYPSLVVAYFTYKARDNNILHNNTLLTHQTLIGINSEMGTAYVEKIKKIRAKLPGTAFSSILIAAFSASISDYFKKVLLKYC